ncbi:hypothetical protein [Halobacillus sp. B29]|uniref:hypothetical protein n=1 Tax=Halobacillus sp. B29 TaxID=3457432 RepID=UPI003FCD58D0
MFKKIDRRIWIALGLILIFPIIFNYTFLQFSVWGVVGDEDSWISFWGNYSGGLISALVAYIVAKTQVKKQYENEMSSKRYTEFISQLPSLIRTKIELEMCYQNLLEAAGYRDGFIQYLMTVEYANEDLDDYADDIEVDKNSQSLTLQQINANSFELINDFFNTDLSIQVVSFFNFYHRFVKALAYEDNFRARDMEDTYFMGEKFRLWNKFDNGNVLDEVNKLIEDLNKEIQRVKIAKETGSIPPQ